MFSGRIGQKFCVDLSNRVARGRSGIGLRTLQAVKEGLRGGSFKYCIGRGIALCWFADVTQVTYWLADRSDGVIKNVA